ncbi:hypothetical protein ACNKHN_16600 [Shigella flexneri]
MANIRDIATGVRKMRAFLCGTAQAGRQSQCFDVAAVWA